MGLVDQTGVTMPGGSDEAFQHGVDLNGIWQDVPPVGGYPGIGGFDNGMDVSGGAVHDPGLGTDGSSLFSDSLDARVFQGMDSMVGVAGLGGIHVEQPEQAEMYSSESSLPFDFPIENTSDPLLDADEIAEGS